MFKKLVCFDFDDTLFHTPLPEDGKIIWEEKTNTPWPYIGWWSKPESIDNEIFSIPKNEWTYIKYLEEISNPENYVILATGRLKNVPGMLDNVKKILYDNNISFSEDSNGDEEINLNWGGDTFLFKIRLFEQKIKELGVGEFTMYDDRAEHLPKFEEWAKEQSIKINIVDVVNKSETIVNNL